MQRLNLGCGRNPMAGWINVDQVALPGVDVVADLNACATTKLPFEPDSIDELLMSHFLEHVPNVLPLMQELHRIARADARITVLIPHGGSDDAWEDPTHVRPYFPGSFGYFTQPYYWRADYGYRGDWQPEKVVLRIGESECAGQTAQELWLRSRRERNVVREMMVILRAVKPIREPRRELQEQPVVEVVSVP